MSTTKFAIGYLGGMVIFTIFVWVGVALHMAYTKMDVMLEHLKNFTDIMARAPLLLHGGPWGKLLMVGAIVGALTFPGWGLSAGRLNAIV